MHSGSPTETLEEHSPSRSRYLPHTACTPRSGSRSTSSARTGRARTVAVCQAAEGTGQRQKRAVQPFLQPKHEVIFQIICFDKDLFPLKVPGERRHENKAVRLLH